MVLICDLLTSGHMNKYLTRLSDIEKLYLHQVSWNLDGTLGLSQVNEIWETTDNLYVLSDLDISTMATSNSEDSYKLQSRIPDPNLKLTSLSNIKIILDPNTTYITYLTFLTMEIRSHTPKSNQFTRKYQCVHVDWIWISSSGLIMHTRFVMDWQIDKHYKSMLTSYGFARKTTELFASGMLTFASELFRH